MTSSHAAQSHTSNCHAMQPYWDVLSASVQADALQVALELGFFCFLPDAPRARSLASLLGTDADATRHLLNLLWSMGLLTRTADTASDGADLYTLKAVTSEHFVRASPRFCGDAWIVRLKALRESGARLRNRLTSPAVAATGAAPAEATPSVPPSSPPGSAAMGALWANAARAQIGQEQRAFTVAAASRVMARVPAMNTATRLLDLGGGPGWVAIALANDFPRLNAVVFDLPDTAEVAQENITAAGLDDRLSVIGGDLAIDDIGTGYDVIWCASVLHFVPDVAATLRRIHAALRPGGVLVCAQAEVGATPREAAAVLPYYLTMMMLGRHVTAAGEMAQALRDTGFTNVDSVVANDFPMAPLTVWTATRAVP